MENKQSWLCMIVFPTPILNLKKVISPCTFTLEFILKFMSTDDCHRDFSQCTWHKVGEFFSESLHENSIIELCILWTCNLAKCCLIARTNLLCPFPCPYPLVLDFLARWPCGALRPTTSGWPVDLQPSWIWIEPGRKWWIRRRKWDDCQPDTKAKPGHGWQCLTPLLSPIPTRGTCRV